MLALLPTAAASMLEAMNTENITLEIQQIKGSAGAAARSVGSAASRSASPPSIGDTAVTEDDGRSMASLQSESGVHASQVALPSPVAAAGEGAQEGGLAPAQRRKTKRQLWDELTISCEFGDGELPLSLSLHPSPAELTGCALAQPSRGRTRSYTRSACSPCSRGCS